MVKVLRADLKLNSMYWTFTFNRQLFSVAINLYIVTLTGSYVSSLLESSP